MAAAAASTDVSLRHSVDETANGLTAHRFDADCGSSFTIFEHGCTMTSFRDVDGVERLYCSPTALFDGKTAIRGGIPIVFPQFGPDGPLPSHGFARTSTWSFEGVKRGAASFVLQATAATMAVWPHTFTLRFTVTPLARGFTSELSVENTGSEAFEFQALQHTYHALTAAEGARVEGLEGVSYLDKLDVDAGVLKWSTTEPVVIDKEVDSIFMRSELADPPDVVVPGRSAGGKSIRVQAKALLTSAASSSPEPTPAQLEMVVWNAWVEKAKTMGDLPDDGYKAYVCIEPGRVAGKETLPPRTAYCIVQTVSYE